MTIFSNNCWAGHVYRYFRLPYDTPTVGLYFFAEDYVRFLRKPKYYLSLPLIFIQPSESKHFLSLVKKGEESLKCPIARLDDVEIVFLHYKSEDEVRDKWGRRTKRINWDRLIVKMSEMNDCSYEILKQFDGLPYKNKFVFTTRDYGLKSQIIFGEYEGQPEILNDTTHFRRYINLINLFKNME